MEPVRRRALIDAAIAAIGERGSLDVTMSDIAGRAGVSAALAHHYFGAKDGLMQATMRHILRELATDASRLLATQSTSRARLSAVIAVSFSPNQFRPEIVAAWLAFYVEAQRSEPMRRLFRIYARRLNSNLMDALRPLAPARNARRIAEAIAAMIDGLYIRCALRDGAPDARSAIALVEDYVETKLSCQGGAA